MSGLPLIAHAALACLPVRLGKHDTDNVLCDILKADAVSRGSTAIVRWYLAASINRDSALASLANEWLDALEDTAPSLVYEISMTAAPSLKAVDRVFRLIDAGKLPAQYLHGFMSGNAIGDLASERFRDVLLRLVSPIIAGDRAAIRAAFDLISLRLSDRNHATELAEFPSLGEVVWSILTAAGARVESARVRMGTHLACSQQV